METLNEEQFLASRPDRGVSLVLAGAGTGKTSTLVEKVRNVIREIPLPPENALVLTFSKKAAGELRDRISAGIAAGPCQIATGTFHSFCLDLLRSNGELFMGKYGFSALPGVLDEDEKNNLIRSIIYPELERFLGLPAGIVHELMIKADSLDAWTRRKLERAGLIEELGCLRRRYAELKRDLNLIDFEDMMEFAIRLLEENPGLRRAVHEQYRYVFVDEFQDVSDDNFRLMKLILPDAGGNLFAVGDDWQSIYGFRNARVEYTVKIRKYFPGAVVRRLTVNYRSREEIVRLSNRFIRKNRFRTRKRLVSRRGKGGLVRFHAVRSHEEEARVIAAIMARADPGASIAVLYRNNWQGRLARDLIYPDGQSEMNVSFMTMHASKGLEFDTVIVAGVADGIIPDRDSDREEERRILYVAMTRARDELHVIAHLNDAGQVGQFGKELGIRAKHNVSIR